MIAAFLPDMTPESHEAFLELVADEVETAIRLYQDQAGTHRSQEVVSPSHVHCSFIPPYSPELNPCERFFEELRKALAGEVLDIIPNKVFEHGTRMEQGVATPCFSNVS